MRFLRPVLFGLLPFLALQARNGQEHLGLSEVVLTLTGNTARIHQFAILTLQNLGNPKDQPDLKEVAPGLSRDTSIFVGWVRPGEYTLSELRAGRERLDLSEGNVALIGTFKAEPDSVTDLGRLVLTGVGDEVVLGRSALMGSNADLLATYLPELAPKPGMKVLPGWEKPRAEKDRVEELAHLAPAGAECLTELPGGGVAAASRMGSLLLRDPKGGRWRVLRTGRLGSFLTLCGGAPDAQLAAGGEFDLLARLDAQGGLSVLDPGNLPPGNIIFLQGSETQGWTLLHQRNSALTVFQSARLDKGDWKPLRQEPLKGAWESFFGGESRFFAWPTQEGFAYTGADGPIHVYDRATQAWSERALPRHGSVDQAVRSVHGLVLVMSGSYLSTDEGRSWKELQNPGAFFRLHKPGLGISRYTATTPVLSSEGLLLQWVWYGRKAGLYRSKDLGSTWEQVGAEPSEGAQLVALPTQGVFAIDDGAFSDGHISIEHLSGPPAAWTTEYGAQP